MAWSKRRDLRQIHAFQHTHIGVYMVGSFALLVVFTESTQGICEKYHINKKWFCLYGVLCFFAYLYARPFIRAGLGSASRGYINVWALYLLWLCSAVFYHLPSLSSLGFDIRADISFGISVFFGSLLVLSVLHIVHAVAVGLRWLSPMLAPPGTRLQQIATTLLLNSGAVAAACSLYFGFCGNGSPPGLENPVKHAVCSKWLHPILTTEYPEFARMMLYGEGVMKNETVIGIDFPLDGLGITLIPAGHVISPVFTLWVTLLLLYVVNACADHLAAGHMEFRSVSELRPQMSEPNLRELLKTFAEATSPRKARSMELPKGSRRRRLSTGSTMVDLVETLVESTHKLGQWGAAFVEQGAAFVEQHQSQLKVLEYLNPDWDKEVDGPQPNFLPMVPWWSGTSADLFKTLFDLMVSVKLFLGRFDMRTMQAATAASMADSFNDRPSEGDGFTYEHCVNRHELWLDFMADTGDGGNPTYTVARALAAPKLNAELPADMSYDGPQVYQEYGSSSRHVQLPRAELLLIGGDLAYPNPSKDTYEQRLFIPFQDAMPPPPHYHPGRLVVHKPDLPPAYGIHEVISRPGVQGLSPRSSRRASAAALRDYSGPMAFAIPGNHDWIDGLETFIKQIQHKGWLGGWLLPQEKSYFSLHLPHGWWLFGFDLALVMDIDMCQYRYFANVVEQRMAPDDQVIIMTHEPIWLLDWYWQGSTTTNLRQLVRGHLRGRARLHLAGDLHFYMRHTFQPSIAPKSTPLPIPVPTHTEDSNQDKQAHRTSLSSSMSTPFSPLSKSAFPADNSRPVSWRPSDDPPSSSTNRGHGWASRGANGSAAGASKGPSGGQGVREEGNRGEQEHRVDSSSRGTNGAPGEGRRGEQGTGAGESRGTNGAAQAISSSIGEESDPRYSSRGTGRAATSGAAGGGAGSRIGPGSWAADGSQGGHRTGDAAGSTDATPSVSSQTKQGLGWEGGSLVGSSLSSAPFNLPCARTAQAVQQHIYASNSQLDLHENRHGLSNRIHGHVSQQSTHDSIHGHVDGCNQEIKDPTDHSMPDIMGGCSLKGASSFEELEGASDGAASSSSSCLSSSSGDTPWLRGLPKPLSTVSITAPISQDAPSIAGRSPVPSLTIKTDRSLEDDGVTQRCNVCRKRLSQPHLYDPEHLVVNGLGGAFLHPTHPFKDARFTSMPDDAAEATAAIYSIAHQPCACQPSPPAPISGRWYYGPGTVDLNEAPQISTLNGEYTCRAAYPPPEKTHKLGMQNLHVFRLKNSRFDIIGGMAYFLMIVSTLPRCSSIASIIDADSFSTAAAAFVSAYFDALHSIVQDSYTSLGVVLLLFSFLFSLARAGGVGAASTVANQPRPGKGGAAPDALENQLRGARFGGMPMQLLFACSHMLAHLNVAVTLMLLLELGVVTLMRYGSLGQEGMHSLYNWFVSYEQQHFPDPMGLRKWLEAWTGGLYPAFLKHAMTAFDIPEVIASVRSQMCTVSNNSNVSAAALTRNQYLGYYLGMLAYYWVLATPCMGLVFGIYLYISVCFCHVHYDEAFSALRIPSYKGFSRMHITPDGDLELFSLATNKVPSAWQLDPRWSGIRGGGSKKVVGHKARYPSKWIPAEATGYDTEDDQLSPSNARQRAGTAQDVEFKVVDYVKIPKQRVWESTETE